MRFFGKKIPEADEQRETHARKLDFFQQFFNVLGLVERIVEIKNNLRCNTCLVADACAEHAADFDHIFLDAFKNRGAVGRRENADVDLRHTEVGAYPRFGNGYHGTGHVCIAFAQKNVCNFLLDKAAKLLLSGSFHRGKGKTKHYLCLVKNFFGVLNYVRGYWRYGMLNITFNILSVFFNLFSLLSLIPLLRLLFYSKLSDFQANVAKGEPVIGFSLNDVLDWVNFKISTYILSFDDMDEGRLKALAWICVCTITVIFFKSLFRYLAMFFLAVIRNSVVRDFRNRMYNKSLRLQLSWYSGERKGDIMSRVSADVQEVEWSIMSSLEMIFREPITVVVFLVSLFMLSMELTIMVLVATPLAGLILAMIAKSLKRSSGRAKEQLGLLNSLMEEMLGGLRIIKGFNAEKKVYNRFASENEKYTQTMISNYRKVDLASPLTEFLIVIVLCIVMYYGGKLILDNDNGNGMTGDKFIGYLAVFSQLVVPVRQFTQAYFNVQKGLASVERINKILDAEETIKENPVPKQLPRFEKEITYDNLSFAYNRGDDGWALKNVHLNIKKGQSIALVGQSGSGKTTLADLLPRFYDPTGGEIRIDGIPIRDVGMTQLRDLMGIVSQESILFNDTIYNNIAFGVTDTTPEQVIAAAKVANAHDFIEEQPEGYQTNIGDRGMKLSGGQKQRIAIARAVLKNPPILILDEATSALDTESERLVQDALNKLMQNRTSIIIAHRLSTIQHADEIIVLQKGEIIERGTHQALLEKQGAYKKLYDLQLFV